MATIKAPFNFVPLQNTVFFPEWAHEISHDIPFSDGISGKIELTIISHTPIFIRNGNDNRNSDHTFSHTEDGKFFIPASSIKGEIRNVLEILSLGKMNRVVNARFGYRDLSNTDNEQNTYCGWLWQNSSGYYLQDGDIPKRIAISDIDKMCNTKFDRFVHSKEQLKNDENRTARRKYKELQTKCAGKIELINNYFLTDYFAESSKQKNSSEKIVEQNKEGEKGTLVLTGQPGERKDRTTKQKASGKYYEFIFPPYPTKEKLTNSHPVDPWIIEDFISIHKNSPDYINLWQPLLKKGEATPVFFQKDKNGKISSIGLSYMYKIPYHNSIYHAIPKPHLLKNIPDLAECIFGYTHSDREKHSALKGRVFFSHAFAVGNPQPLPEQHVILGSPKPSYYPLYLKKGYNWNSKDAEIAGRKRYPVRATISTQSKTENSDIESTITPLPENCEFSGKIIFHNLKKIELGSLLSAITFHQQENCYHSIGEAKPLGYGKVSILIKNIECTPRINVNELYHIFANKMESCLTSTVREQNPSQKRLYETYPNWHNAIKELLMMAQGIPQRKEECFQYMRMDTNSQNNEFKKAKKDNEWLDSFSNIIGNTPNTTTPKIQEGKRQDRKALEEEISKIEQDISLANNLLEKLKILLSQKKYTDIIKKNNEWKTITNKQFIPSIKNDIEKIIQKASKHQEQIQKEVTAEVELLNKQAHEAEDRQDYETAICKYKEADILSEKHHLRVCNSDNIEECKRKIERRNQIAKQNLSDFLTNIKPSSPKSFASSLQKYQRINTIQKEDIQTIYDFLISKIHELSNAQKKNWKNKNEWKTIQDIIGEDNVQNIYNKCFVEK